MNKHIKDELSTLTDIILRTVPVERIFLFGSYAYGNPGPDSDLDIYVVMPESAEIREIDAMMMINRAIRNSKSMPVDVIVGRASTFDRRKSAPTIERLIAQEGVALYG